jgi:hypothetical protein
VVRFNEDRHTDAAENLVKVFFGIITRQAIRCGSFA